MATIKSIQISTRYISIHWADRLEHFFFIHVSIEMIKYFFLFVNRRCKKKILNRIKKLINVLMLPVCVRCPRFYSLHLPIIPCNNSTIEIEKEILYKCECVAILFAFLFVSFWRTLCLSSSFSHACYLLNERKKEEKMLLQNGAWWEISGNDLTQLGAHIVSTHMSWHTYFFFRPFRIIAAVIHFVWRIFLSFFFFSSAFILLIIVSMKHTIRFVFQIYLNVAKKPVSHLYESKNLSFFIFQPLFYSLYV